MVILIESHRAVFIGFMSAQKCALEGSVLLQAE